MVGDIVAHGMSDAELVAAEKRNKADWEVERRRVAREATGISLGRQWRLSIAGQERILRMIRDGLDSDVIIAEFNASARKNREPFISLSHVNALRGRGIPFAAVAEVHKCPECFAKIVTDFCIACRVKGLREGS
jgi:hypothetical protein